MVRRMIDNAFNMSLSAHTGPVQHSQITLEAVLSRSDIYLKHWFVFSYLKVLAELGKSKKYCRV